MAVRLGAAYEAAREGRLHTPRSRSGSADDESLYTRGLETMRDRSRELVRDDPHAASIVRVIEDNVVGTGIRAQSRARAEETGLSDTQVEEWNDRCDEVFNAWASSTEPDATGHHDLYGMQRLVCRVMHIDGEAFVHPIMVRPAEDPRRRFMTSLELIEAERVAPKDGSSSETNREGVIIGSRGQAIAYEVSVGHPGDRFTADKAFDFRTVRRFRDGRVNMMHLFRRQRPGQSRGVPVLAPALFAFDQLRNYLRYEVVAARINASIAMLIKRPLEQNEPGFSFDETELDGEGNPLQLEGIDAGGIGYLQPGEEMQAFNPNRPGTTFDPFVIRFLRAIGASIGIPYELFARDASNVNYTSSRTLLLEAFRGFRCVQDLIVCLLNAPVRELVLVEAYARGDLPTYPQFNDPRTRRAMLRAAWIPPARGWVDPVKEILASEDAIRNHLSTRSDEAAASGRDFEETARINARQLKLLLELEQENDLPPGSMTGAAPAAAAPGGGGGDDGDDDQAEGDDDENDEADDQGEEREGAQVQREAASRRRQHRRRVLEGIQR